MGYHTTADLAARHGLTIPAARYYLLQSGYTPKRTDYLSPRHTRVLSWPEPAARWLANRLTQRPIQPPPDPMRWLPFSVASAKLGLTRQRLNQLTASGRIRSRRVLVQTRKGARWLAFCHAGDVAAYPETRHNLTQKTPADMSTHLPLRLVRAWLLLLDLEQSLSTSCLAAYTADAPHIHLLTGLGQLHMLPTSCPEACPTLPTPVATPPAALDQWSSATAAMQQALDQLLTSEKPLILSISANAVALWRKEPGYPLIAEYPLPHPTAVTA